MNMHELCATGSKATNKQSNKNVNMKLFQKRIVCTKFDIYVFIWLFVGCFTPSGTHFMHIHGENMSKII
jgi:hypothetical protein